MATEKRSIEISYKANLKDLVSKLKELPEITGQEAKKMVAALDRQVKQAEKAASKSAKASSAAAKASSKAAKAGSADFNSLDKAGSAAAESLDDVADGAGDADRGFTAIALGLRQVNPALGEAADNAADFASVGEGMLKGFKSLNPWILAAAAAVATLTYAFTSYQDSIKQAEQATLDYREAIKSLRAEEKALNDNLISSSDIYRSQVIQYAELTGQIDKYSAALMRTQIQIEQQYGGQLDQADKIITSRNEDILIVERLLNGEKAITDENRERLKTLQLQLSNGSKKLDLTETGLRQEADLGVIRNKLADKLAEEISHREKIEKAQGKALEMAEQLNEYQKEYDTELALEEQRKANIAGLSDGILSTEEERNAALAEAALLMSQQLEMSNKLLALRGTEIEQIASRYDLEFSRMSELALETRDFETFKEISQALYEDRAAEYHDLEMKRIEERRDSIMDGSKMLISSLDTFAQASIDYLNNTDKATEESLQKLHKLRQAAAIANIAMTTAEAIAQAMLLPPGLRGLAIGAATAAGAMQIAVVASEPPPTLHMGGMAPDERTRVLTGEAVLDRTTTRRLGDEGVRNLQNNTAGGAEVIVLQPFKHFDRYNRSARRRAGRRAGSGSY
jgi:hypothetical protein